MMEKVRGLIRTTWNKITTWFKQTVSDFNTYVQGIDVEEELAYLNSMIGEFGLMAERSEAEPSSGGSAATEPL